MKEMLLLTVFGITNYLIADIILNWLESRRGGRYPRRTIIFFAIFLTLTIVAFQGVQLYKA